MYGLCSFLTHYFEADKGPFRNICDLSDEQIEFIIEAEKGAETAFNRFALGSDFFKLRRAADDLLIWLGVKDSFSLKSHTPVSHFMICFSPTLNCRRRSGLITLTRASRKRNAVVCGRIRT
jgi:hypothetical protein